jgi:hypothetical protein
MAITQEDCISAHRAEKKRKIHTRSSSGQSPRYRLVQNTSPRAPPRNNQSGRWIARPLSSLDSTGHQCLSLNSSSNSLDQGRTLHSSTRETITIVVSIAAAHRISSRIALNLGNHSKGGLPTQPARAKARSKLYKSAKGG